MHLSTLGELTKSHRTHEVSNERYAAFWEGLAFLPGCREGRESMAALLSRIVAAADQREIISAVNGLCGAWALFLHDKARGEWLVCGDQEIVESVYYGEVGISNSFLALRSKLPDRTKLDDASVASVLHCGHNYASHFFYDSLRRLDFRQYLHLVDGRIKVHEKGLPDLFSSRKNGRSYLSVMEGFLKSFQGHRICLDLTGGTDSRTMAICLHHLGAEFETATDGMSDYSEVVIAKKVAGLLQKPHRSRDLHRHDFQPSDLTAAWEACEGVDYSLRSYLFEAWRRQFDYTVVLSTFAGELYKDGGWFYRALPYCLVPGSLPKYIHRLVHSGIAFFGGLPPDDFRRVASARYVSALESIQDETYRMLVATYGNRATLEAADRIFREFSVNFPRGTGNSVINRFLPLMEPEMVAFGVNQPWFMRVNHLMYRKQVGSLHPSAARIPTDREHLTLSPRPFDLAMDSLRYGRAAINYVTKKPTTVTKNRDGNADEISAYVREHPETRRAFENLKDRGVLHEAYRYEDLNTRMALRVVQLHLLYEAR